MSLEGLVKQELFVLTRDMVPIHFTGFEQHGVSFICPLPKGFKKVIETHYELIISEVDKIVEEINGKAQKKESPFENIMLGYQERSEEEQKSLLRLFQITEIKAREGVGVYGAYCGHDGDIYLDSATLDNCEFMTLDPISDLFEPNTAFLCHNVDWYWQALLDREFCVRYFNLLNRLFFGK